MLKGKNYCITKGNIMAHEMIGLEAKVVKSSDSTRLVQGLVVDETRNTFVFECNGSEKVVPKSECDFEFAIGDEKAIVHGGDILYAPEQRVKALWRN